MNSQCHGPLGTNNETAFPPVRDNRFYLNTAAPAPCSGTVTEGRFCYYPSNTNITMNHRFYALVAVYRRRMTLTDDSDSYENVSSMLTIRLTGRQLNNARSDLVCATVNVSDFDVDIEAGDVLGACVFNPSGGPNRRLLIVGQASGYSLMEMNSTGCSLDAMPSNVSTSDLSNVNSRLLHVYANITRK